jgi:solute carrier family 35, member F1/2
MAFAYTSLTSASIIQDFAIPSAVFLSIFFLKVQYKKLHFVAIAICIVGISLGFLNDYLFVESASEDDDQSVAPRPLLGDFLALASAFLYALDNVLQEYLIKKSEDVFNILGFLGFFGAIITLVEALIVNEFAQFESIPASDRFAVASNYIGMAVVNFMVYTTTPFFIKRSGATLLNLSNVTTIIWSMLSDILLFGGKFYPTTLCAFAVEMTGIILYSQEQPRKPK